VSELLIVKPTAGIDIIKISLIPSKQSSDSHISFKNYTAGEKYQWFT
jgi:hypothetical protein